MYFHIDESGHTGNHLFDPNQPRLSYGLLSSTANVDALGDPLYRRMLNVLGEPSLHGTALGVDRLTRIAPLLLDLQAKMKFDFDYYFIDKTTYALVLLFDAVFDAGLNEAVKWDSYWTPLRFVLIYKLSSLFDEDLLKEAWRLCISKQISRQAQDIVKLLEELKLRAEQSGLDERTKELMADAFSFGIAHPLNLGFGVPDQKIVSPNAVCFQFVVSAMAMRLRKKGLRDASSIIVDQQTEFNKAQIGTHYNLKLIAQGLQKISPQERKRYINHPLFEHLGADEITHRAMPRTQIKIQSSGSSIGLQIVDIYLWIANRIQSGAELSDELKYLGASFLKRSSIDGISLEGMIERWNNFERQLPAFENITEQQMEAAQRSVDAHRQKVRSLGI